MFGKKKKAEEKEIAKSAIDLWAFIKAVLVFVEEDPNRVKSFLAVMANEKYPKKEDIQATRADLGRCIAWVNQSITLTKDKT